MEVTALMKLKPNLEKFVQEFDPCIKTFQSRAHLRTYVAGQMSHLDRKSVEPIALAADVPVRTLEEFLSIHRWDEDRVAAQMRKRVALKHFHPEAVGIIDGSGYPKKGKKTAGVARQYCGQTGKIDNCVVAVHLGYAAEDFHCLLDSEVYIPEDWLNDPQRCREAKIPEALEFRTKLQIALALLKRSLNEGVKFAWLLADEEYGRSSDFRNDVSALGVNYLVEVPCDALGWTRYAKPRASRVATMRKRHRLTKGKQGARRVDELWHRGGPSWDNFRVKETEKGPEVWQVRMCRVVPLEKQRLGKECWLIVAYQPRSGETKYCLSSAPENTPRETLLRVAFKRWHIERIFQDGKGEIGLGHFEARLYPAIKRHFVISQLSFLFLAEETRRLRKKTGIEPLSGKESRGGSIRAWIIEAAEAWAA